MSARTFQPPKQESPESRPRTARSSARAAEQGPKAVQLAAMEEQANRSAGALKSAQLEEMLNAPVQRKTGNPTGLGEDLQTGLENLSGMDLSGVRVHHNSPKPAQLQALAYAQGQDIHVAPGQERHLPHEGWHVVQQMQGRVQPTLDLEGTAVNDSPGLEREADIMGAKALQRKAEPAGWVGRGAEAARVVSQRVAIQFVRLSSIDKDIEPSALAGHDFGIYSIDTLRNLATELEEKAGADQVNRSYYETAVAAIQEAVRDRQQRLQENMRLLAEYEEESNAIREQIKKAEDTDRSGRDEIDKELAFLDKAYGALAGFTSLTKKIRSGKDGWDSEAAPYMRELFLGIAESGRFEVQLGSVNGIGGDVVLKRKQDKQAVSTIQSKYFAGGSLQNVEDDLHKAIEQLGGKYGETPAEGSKRVVDAVVANEKLAAELGKSDITKLVQTAVDEAAKSLGIKKDEAPVDQVLIALPSLKAQYRVAVVSGKVRSAVRVGITPRRFDLPGLHKGRNGKSIEDLFKRVEGGQKLLKELRGRLGTLKLRIDAVQEKARKIAEGTGEVEEESFGLDFE